MEFPDAPDLDLHPEEQGICWTHKCAALSDTYNVLLMCHSEILQQYIDLLANSQPDTTCERYMGFLI